MSDKVDDVECKDSGDAAGTDYTDAKAFGKLSDRLNQSSLLSRPVQETAHGPASGDAYNMAHKRRGMAVIVNNREFAAHTKMPPRSGTEADAAALHRRFKDLGFEVFLFNNVKMEQFLKIIKDASRTNHSDCDCFSMVILTHGEEGVIYATDGTIEVNEIFEPFNGKNCASLVGKPKLFFIQACRGTKLDDGVAWSEDLLDMTDAAVPKIPSEADFLLAYSVVPGHFSWRNSTNGSWFAQALSDVLERHGNTMDLMTMMTRVNKKVAYDFESNATRVHMSNKKQIPCVTSMLTKDVYFPPK